MSKVLKVIKPYYVMEVGDVLTLSQDGKTYVCSQEVGENDGTNGHFFCHTSTFTISVEYAKFLIQEGFLAENDENSQTQTFVNVFDEIENLINSFTKELNSIDEDMAESPACLKIEKQTVLSNLITTLKHLYSLKKN